MKSTLVLLLAFIIVALFGCASPHISDDQLDTSKQILDITLDENPQSVILSIKGNQALTYTSEVERNPRGLYLKFPETIADNVTGRFIPPNNGTVSSIRVNNFKDDQTELSIVFVEFNPDAVYEIISGDSDIQIHFTKKADMSYVIQPSAKSAAINPVKEKKSESLSVQPATRPASQLKKVRANAIEASTTITLEADGTIADYKTFKLISPDRIVFDFYNLKSPDRRQKTIGVRSELVHRIRYYGHPDKLRLVIDTRKNRRLKYSSESTDTGLVIQVNGFDTPIAAVNPND